MHKRRRNGRWEANCWWVYYPFKDQMWSARRGEGAWLNGDKITVKDKELKDGIVAIGRARYNEGDKDSLFDMVQKCYQHSLSVRNSKSAAIDLARVASGENVAYIERYLQPYDYAAASVIIEEAGGIIIMQTNETPITIGHGCSILAGTPKAIEQIQKPKEKRKKRRRRRKRTQSAKPKQKAPSE